MGTKSFNSHILVFVILVLSWAIITPDRGHALGLSDSFPRSYESWLPKTYKGSQSIQAFLNGYNFSHLPGQSIVMPSRMAYLPQSDLLFSTLQDQDAISLKQMGLMDQVTSDSGSILAMAVGTIAFLYVMPESFSKWPQEKKDLSPNKLWERYDDSISGGPVWDHDKPEVNYIGHPYFGAAYYTHAMNKNFTRLESLSYAFMMSTCVYEYGLEAFFEDPSIQDIFVTPLAGALFGEAFIAMSDRIHSNEDKVIGSKILGSICLFMLDPISAALKPVNSFNERYSKLHMDANYYTRTTLSDNISDAGTFYDHRAGVEISISTDAFFR